ncbi:Gp19/Gp15/Gp42 family protein [Cellulomonas palmilytica]|uniref:Gp19/Gp15/Gp42 family protein n=1 Tax=Cellulomonas palmilytica TaxID=2608402 RepID=UPI001F3C8B2B|nr:Gp19/Gp15/Gp42 family protein [Cellulomonas palmilytica]UJP39331.1 hypothetical protein F1D97_13435 [Cellulomonas palmilytica]
MTLARVEDVQTRLGRPIADDEAPQVDALLRDVEAMIRNRIRDLDDRALDPVFLELAVMVEANAVVRVLRNPEGLRTWTVAVDDGSVTKTRDQATSAGGLYVTDDEWALLDPPDVPTAFSSPIRYEPGWHGAPLTRWGRP